MGITTVGVVKNGCIQPNVELPEGAVVRIEVVFDGSDLPDELREEMEFWCNVAGPSIEETEELASRLERGEIDVAR